MSVVLKQKNHLMHVCRCFTHCTKQNVAKIDTHHPDLYLGLGRLFTNELNKAPQKSQSIIIIGTNLNQSSSSKIKLDLLEREREREIIFRTCPMLLYVNSKRYLNSTIWP